MSKPDKIVRMALQSIQDDASLTLSQKSEAINKVFIDNGSSLRCSIAPGAHPHLRIGIQKAAPSAARSDTRSVE